MTFLAGFLRTLLWRPLPALGALYWYATGRKVRARNRLRLSAAHSPYVYDVWMETVENQDLVEKASTGAIAGSARNPVIALVVYNHKSLALDSLQDTLTSLEHQSYPQWELVVVLDRTIHTDSRFLEHPQVRVVKSTTANTVEALITAVQSTSADYILPVHAGARLAQAALYRYAEAIKTDPDGAIFFGDHDYIDPRGKRSRPWLKPRWNSEMFLAQDYITQACVIRTVDAQKTGPIDWKLADAAAYALLLSMSRRQDAKIVHIPYILSHIDTSDLPDDRIDRIRAVGKHLAEQKAAVREGLFGTVRVDWPLPSTLPFVSIIVPTRDKRNLLKACIDGVLARTSYGAYEVIIVDNGSSDARALEYLQRIDREARVSVLRYELPFNYSAINNFAVAHARGDYICLLNNDTEVLDGEWLTELMRQAVRPEVGAAGAKLLYADGSIQHAGVVVGMGEAAGHAHRFLRKNDPGYFAQAYISRFVTAVTAACLVVEKRKFVSVGGLDEKDLQVAFNDVDLCMRLQEAGWHNVYVPYASLIHHESKSRGRDASAKHIQRYMRELAVLQDRWGTKDYLDPSHHPSLDRGSERYLLRL